MIDMNKSTKDYMKKDFAGRKSNFECIRILAMLMIIGHHLAIHGIQHFGEETAYHIWSTGTALNQAFACVLLPGGAIGVALFFMITGYFQIDKNKTNLTKIILEPFLYGSCLCVLCMVLMFTGMIDDGGVSFKTIILLGIRSVFNPATGGNWWFVTVYFFLMLLSPLLNHFLRLLTKKGMFIFILLFWAIWYSIPYFTSNIYSSMSKGIFYYMIGAFCRLFGKSGRRTIKKWQLFILTVVLWLAGGVCWYIISYTAVADSTSIDLSIVSRFSDQLFVSVATPLCSLGIFILFASSDIGSVKWINMISGTTFGVYLIHDADIARAFIWHKILRVDTLQYASSLFPLYALLSIGSVFCCCALIDLGRKKWIEPWMTERFQGLVKRAKHLLCE